MKNYYLLSWGHKRDLASANALQALKSDHELIAQLGDEKSLPFDFELRRVIETGNGLVVNNDLARLSQTWLDYQPNNLAWPLMSERLRSVIESNLTGKEMVDWITCKVKGVDGERLYFILRFKERLDVLDVEKTTFVHGTDHVIKPVFKGSKVARFGIFHKPLSHELWKITPGLYISETVKEDIWRQKLTGMDFEKVSVSW
ncbi:DUF1629 domain-containing protein [Chitinophaga sp.]|uniref:imm11 family protein n=1 Tax=Chitinophaga sp. TaxID=1869181 RepID=UPI0031D9FB1E